LANKSESQSTNGTPNRLHDSAEWTFGVND
jgi:hypothetical protein